MSLNFKPSSITEAVELLGRHGTKARILAGGTDLINELKLGYRVPEELSLISRG